MDFLEKPSLNELVKSIFSEEVSTRNEQLADEILSHLGTSAIIEDEDNIIMHYGIKRRSGRYPYGSGEEPYQHGSDFLSRVNEMKKAGFTYTDENGNVLTGDKAIEKYFNLNSTEYRRQISWANYETRLHNISRAKSLRDDGLGSTAIGKIMGVNESTVRSYLNPDSENRLNQSMETVNMLREQVDAKGMIDVTAGVEKSIGVARTRLDTAIDYLQKAEGYEVYTGGIPQINNKGQQTIQKVLCRPGTEHKEIYNYENVKTINDYESLDGGDTFQKKFTYPASLDSKRLMVRYADDVDSDGFRGIDKDGTIELRRGVKDLDLGDSRYAQVRILVDGTHYLKGIRNIFILL